MQMNREPRNLKEAVFMDFPRYLVIVLNFQPAPTLSLFNLSTFPQTRHMYVTTVFPTRNTERAIRYCHLSADHCSSVTGLFT